MASLSLATIVTVLAIALHAIAQPIAPVSPHSVQIVHKKRYYDYSSSTIRGVNIGGWLLLEPYITPSLFEAFRTSDSSDEGIPVDEYHFCQQLGYDTAESRLVQHWNSWYTEQDFQNMAGSGLNFVRIPIGYWAFKMLDSDPYVSGYQEALLDKAIGWARDNNLKVWVDVHGMPGSQNGFDNSGLRDSYSWLSDSTNYNLSLEVIEYVLEKYSRDEFLDTVIGVELVNEPLGPVLDMDKLKEYYAYGYNYVRNTLGRNQDVIIHDAFQPFHYWDATLTDSDGDWGVVVDHHHYQVFSNPELQRSSDERVQVACGWGSGTVTESHWTVAGEWAGATTDCTKWINGVGYGARYDGSFSKGSDTSSYIGSCQNNEDISSWSDDRKTETRKFIEAQLDAFELRGGWVFWCYKTETSIEWDFQRLIYNNLFPQPLTDRQFPNQCGFNN
ncbi:LAMI_0C00716g1_1 [Lachancea mirantina]|uniref:glucan 1,3-beta-glucosidase n=1 Tax=Lachancea mirantina TaxID=1230905 RepID=A0A1G4J0B7_9SACH|nr:LAMI_0C00716g1_1 [Lachancea mirantina]